MSKVRVVAFTAIAAVVTLAWVLPAAAHHAAAKGTTVNVTAGKPSGV